MNDIQKGLSFLFLPLVTGCVALAIGAGNLEAENNRDPMVDATLHHSVNQVHAAARQALQTLKVQVEQEDSIRSGRKILATAPNQKMILILEPLAAASTRFSIHTPSEEHSATPKDTLLEILRRTQNRLNG